MPDKYKYGFTIKHERAWGWHIGAFFCISPKNAFGHREIYLFLCFGKRDISIGLLETYVGED